MSTPIHHVGGRLGLDLDKPWNRKGLSCNPTLEWEVVLANPDKPLKAMQVLRADWVDLLVASDLSAEVIVRVFLASNQTTS